MVMGAEGIELGGALGILDGLGLGILVVGSFVGLELGKTEGLGLGSGVIDVVVGDVNGSIDGIRLGEGVGIAGRMNLAKVRALEMDLRLGLQWLVISLGCDLAVTKALNWGKDLAATTAVG